MRDEENKFAHKVSADDYNVWWYDRSARVRAVCGKVWVPKLTHTEARVRPQCPECFPVFAISA